MAALIVSATFSDLKLWQFFEGAYHENTWSRCNIFQWTECNEHHSLELDNEVTVPGKSGVTTSVWNTMDKRPHTRYG